MISTKNNCYLKSYKKINFQFLVPFKARVAKSVKMTWQWYSSVNLIEISTWCCLFVMHHGAGFYNFSHFVQFLFLTIGVLFWILNEHKVFSFQWIASCNIECWVTWVHYWSKILQPVHEKYVALREAFKKYLQKTYGIFHM